MGYSAQYLTHDEWTSLHAAYVQHGSGPCFWQVYQELQSTARKRTGDSRIKVANEMARIAEKMGVTRSALFV